MPKELPLYKSHKTVRALEIASISDRQADGGHKVFFKDESYDPVLVNGAVFSRYIPVPGDFFVVYDDGYQSFSPRKAFLDGYSPVAGLMAEPTAAEIQELGSALVKAIETLTDWPIRLEIMSLKREIVGFNPEHKELFRITATRWLP